MICPEELEDVDTDESFVLEHRGMDRAFSRRGIISRFVSVSRRAEFSLRCLAMRGRDEILSGIKKTDALIPVITVVVYYGEKPWDGATSLHGMWGLVRILCRL